MTIEIGGQLLTFIAITQAAIFTVCVVIAGLIAHHLRDKP